MTGAWHAPVDGRQVKSGGGRIVHYHRTQSLVAPVPIEKSADFEMDGREDFKILSACGRRH
ncbi:MAG: hypothetical protein ACI4E5_01915 [Suilimivivens sp.]